MGAGRSSIRRTRTGCCSSWSDRMAHDSGAAAPAPPRRSHPPARPLAPQGLRPGPAGLRPDPPGQRSLAPAWRRPTPLELLALLYAVGCLVLGLLFGGRVGAFTVTIVA